MVKRGALYTNTITSLSVTVANGDKMWVKELCPNVQWKVGEVEQNTDCLVLSLKGCDMVLGVQWLKSLGPILWDFTTLTM